MCVNVRKISLPIESDRDEGCFIGTSSMTPRSVLAKSWRRGASDVVTVAPPVETLLKHFCFFLLAKDMYCFFGKMFVYICRLLVESDSLLMKRLKVSCPLGSGDIKRYN